MSRNEIEDLQYIESPNSPAMQSAKITTRTKGRKRAMPARRLGFVNRPEVL
ncbi:MAG: hypothetical protein NTW87_25055 [Planctomycetota bacterium]|nr:hypothetical protein [Planctomycetota bacterium]